MLAGGGRDGAQPVRGQTAGTSEHVSLGEVELRLRQHVMLLSIFGLSSHLVFLSHRMPLRLVIDKILDCVPRGRRPGEPELTLVRRFPLWCYIVLCSPCLCRRPSEGS